MPKKKQYVVPTRLHYDVFEREEINEGNFIILHVCATATEYEAERIAYSLAHREHTNEDLSYVVRARPTEAHNTLKFYCKDENRYKKIREEYYRERTEYDLAERIVEGSVNGNGRPSPTVVKAVERALS